MTRRLVICLLTIAFMYPTDGVAADDCKFAQDETDKFTKVRTLVTHRNSLESFWGDTKKDNQRDIYVAAAAVGDEMTLRVDLGFTHYVDRMPPDYELHNRYRVGRGSQLLVLMADGSVVSLRSKNGMNPKATATRTSIGVTIDAEASLHYPLDDELIEKLTSQPAAKIRVEGAEENYDFKIHEKSVNDISNAIQCLKANL